MKRRDRYRLDFRALMSQCEENYARMLPLMKAMGDRDSMDVELGHSHHTHTGGTVPRGRAGVAAVALVPGADCRHCRQGWGKRRRPDPP
ncbi:hypothetical protein [Alcanivorax sp.]|uniref:hypothetical protein n=1 Tax=Alcanivorax sp. TaxID=1872427 RepID=UPI0025C2D831|nr:hypothetical protein [Alcanivorax sp.]